MFRTFCFVLWSVYLAFKEKERTFVGFYPHNCISPDFIAQLTDKILDESRN